MRVLLKITGEALGRDEPLQSDNIERLAGLLQPLHSNGIEIGIVIGGGNLFRGKNLIAKGFTPYKAHYIGMTATIMNAIAMEEIFSRTLPVQILSAVDVPRFASFFNYQDAERFYAEKKILIFCGGTGNPYFTTDSAAALRALETESDIMIKATKVPGIYDDDPVKNSAAKYIPFITYDDFIARQLKVLDITAVDLCKQGNLPVIVCDLFGDDTLSRLLIAKERIGSLLSKEDIWPLH